MTRCNFSVSRPATRRGPAAMRNAVEAVPYLLTIFIVWRLYITLGIGHLFDEDFAVYLQQAWNLVHNVPMTKMGVIQYRDPSLPLLYVSPLVYPPLGPLLYAAPILYFGFNLTILKAFQLGLFAAGLLLFCYFMVRRWRFTVLEVCASLAMFAGSAELGRSVNSIGTDLPFIVFLVLALAAITKVVASPRRLNIAWGACAGTAIFLAMDVRIVGVALIPTLAIADLVFHRRLRPAAILIPSATSAALWGVQGLITHSGSSYNAIFHYHFFTPVAGIREFYWALAAPRAGLTFDGVALSALFMLVVFAAVGVAWEAARGTAVAVFILVYTAMLLILPESNTGARYLIPNLLVFGAFAVRGAALIASLLTRRSACLRILPYGAAAFGAAWWLLVPAPLPSGDWKFGVMAAPAEQAFAAVREKIPANAVLATTKPRSFHLFTQRTTIRLPWRPPPEGLVRWLRAHGAAAVVVKTSPPGNRYDYSDCPVQWFCRAAPVMPWANEVFYNNDYALFVIRPDEAAASVVAVPSQAGAADR